MLIYSAFPAYFSFLTILRFFFGKDYVQCFAVALYFVTDFHLHWSTETRFLTNDWRKDVCSHSLSLSESGLEIMWLVNKVLTIFWYHERKKQINEIKPVLSDIKSWPTSIISYYIIHSLILKSSWFFNTCYIESKLILKNFL